VIENEKKFFDLPKINENSSLFLIILLTARSTEAKITSLY